jgi:ribose 5-phosphate isomerase RpiB
MGIENAKKLIKIWLDAQYKPGGRSDPKLGCIREYEKTVYSVNI